MAAVQRTKGRLVEELAAWLHDWPDVRVEQRVFLPTLHDHRKREIDVLLHATVAGYPVRVAIECKNEAGPIGAPLIDAFIGKLADVGIPSQCGVFVSASGYTKGALARAQKAGIRTLILKGLSGDGLKASITETAYQSIVFLVPVIEDISFFSDSAESGPPLFRDVAGKLCGTIPHLLAEAWHRGGIPHRIGRHEGTVSVPKGWNAFLPSGKRITLTPPDIHTVVVVLGRAFQVQGQAEHYALVDPTTSSTEKKGVKASFPELKERCTLTPVDSEEALKRFLQTGNGVRLVQRVPLPRICYFSAFWPLSRLAAERLRAIAARHDGTPLPPTPKHPGFVEDADLSCAWDEPMTLQEFEEIILARTTPTTQRKG